jgi:hypothetical protein
LVFLAGELREAGLAEAAARIEGALAFVAGSPSEFLGESLLALETAQPHIETASVSLGAFSSALADELRNGFAKVGGA